MSRIRHFFKECAITFLIWMEISAEFEGEMAKYGYRMM